MDAKDLECLFLHAGHKWNVFTNFISVGKIEVKKKCIYCHKIVTKLVDSKKVIEAMKKAAYIVEDEIDATNYDFNKKVIDESKINNDKD